MQQVNKYINYLNLLFVFALILRALIANIEPLEETSRYLDKTGVNLFYFSLASFLLATVSNLLAKKWPKIYFVTLALLSIPIFAIYLLFFLSGILGYRS